MRNAARSKNRLASGSILGSAALAAFLGLLPGTDAKAAVPLIKKIVNGQNAAGVDNGWVVFQHNIPAGTLSFYNSKANPNFNPSKKLPLKKNGGGVAGAGAFFTTGGIAFAPCPPGIGQIRCAVSEDGTSGVGLAWGQVTYGGAGGAAGGWISDRTLKAGVTDPDFSIPGLIVGAAYGASPARAFAVGWDFDNQASVAQALVLQLDATTPTYAIQSRINLGTLGGMTSQALGISKNATYVVGIAEDASGVSHAVYAPLTPAVGPGWTDITGNFAAEVIKSRARAASDTGFIAGSQTVKRIYGTTKSVDIGFVYDINTDTFKTFEVTTTHVDVVPMQVLPDGTVVGNLVYLSANSPIKEYHPFMYDGTLHDFGKMGAAYGCRVNAANMAGEMVGSCIPDENTPYGAQGTAFYIDGLAASPQFIDVDAAVHAISDVSIPQIKNYIMGAATGIDDLHEIAVVGRNKKSKTGSIASFFVYKDGYNP